MTCKSTIILTSLMALAAPSRAHQSGGWSRGRGRGTGRAGKASQGMSRREFAQQQLGESAPAPDTQDTVRRRVEATRGFGRGRGRGRGRSDRGRSGRRRPMVSTYPIEAGALGYGPIQGTHADDADAGPRSPRYEAAEAPAPAEGGRRRIAPKLARDAGLSRTDGKEARGRQRVGPLRRRPSRSPSPRRSRSPPRWEKSPRRRPSRSPSPSRSRSPKRRSRSRSRRRSRSRSLGGRVRRRASRSRSRRRSRSRSRGRRRSRSRSRGRSRRRPSRSRSRSRSRGAKSRSRSRRRSRSSGGRVRRRPSRSRSRSRRRSRSRSRRRSRSRGSRVRRRPSRSRSRSRRRSRSRSRRRSRSRGGRVRRRPSRSRSRGRRASRSGSCSREYYPNCHRRIAGVQQCGTSDDCPGTDICANHQCINIGGDRRRSNPDEREEMCDEKCHGPDVGCFMDCMGRPRADDADRRRSNPDERAEICEEKCGSDVGCFINCMGRRRADDAESSHLPEMLDTVPPQRHGRNHLDDLDGLSAGLCDGDSSLWDLQHLEDCCALDDFYCPPPGWCSFQAEDGFEWADSAQVEWCCAHEEIGCSSDAERRLADADNADPLGIRDSPSPPDWWSNPSMVPSGFPARKPTGPSPSWNLDIDMSGHVNTGNMVINDKGVFIDGKLVEDPTGAVKKPTGPVKPGPATPLIPAKGGKCVYGMCKTDGPECCEGSCVEVLAGRMYMCQITDAANGDAKAPASPGKAPSSKKPSSTTTVETTVTVDREVVETGKDDVLNLGPDGEMEIIEGGRVDNPEKCALVTCDPKGTVPCCDGTCTEVFPGKHFCQKNPGKPTIGPISGDGKVNHNPAGNAKA